MWCFSLRADQYVRIGQRPLPPLLGVARVRGGAELERPRAGGVGQVRLARFRRAGRSHRDSELYNLDCVAYESVMLGLFSVWRGESGMREKINEVTLGFSRDGFHWHRPGSGGVPAGVR